MAILTPPHALGAAGQVLSGRLLRLSLGAVWRPAGSGVQVISGCLAGPPNTQGELSLAGNVLTVQAFRAVIQSALDATAGSYEVTNDAPVSFTMTAQHATQFRRSLVVTRVDDSQVSGVASSATTDRAVLEVLDGPLAASLAASVLPTPAGSWLALGEIGIPPVGQTITVTPYNPRTGMRHGILPVIADGQTTTGHDGAAGTMLGQYRDHPLYGLQRWDGTAWITRGAIAPVAAGDATLPAFDGQHRWIPVLGDQVGVGGVWMPATPQLPRIEVKVSAQQAFGGLFMVPFDAAVAAQVAPALTGSPPANEWYLFDTPGRRIQLKRAGLYKIELQVTTNDGTNSQYCRIVTVPTPGVAVNVLALGSAAYSSGYNYAEMTYRAAAGEYVGAQLNTVGAARQDDPVNGLRTRMAVTRLSD